MSAGIFRPITTNAALDPDADGRTNLQESANDGYFYTNPHEADTDGDGIDDGDEGPGLSDFEKGVERLTPEDEKLIIATAPTEAEIAAGSGITITGDFDPEETYRLYLTDQNGLSYVLPGVVSSSGSTVVFNTSTGQDANGNTIPPGEMLGKIAAGAFYIPVASPSFPITIHRYLNIHNGLHSPVLATDMEGTVIWRRAYEPFGSILNDTAITSGATLTLTFLSREYDSDLGLYQLGARWYDPDLGRFISVDPVPGSLNQYAYAGKQSLPQSRSEWKRDGPLSRGDHAL